MIDFSLKYLNLLKTKYAGLNLTRILDDQEFYEKQILDSILPYEQSLIFKNELDEKEKLLDIGFGGGFPLLPLAYHCPHIRAVGIESRNKKVQAVNQLAIDLKIFNAKAYHYRIEDVEIDLPVVVSLKAVGTIMNYLPLLQSNHLDFTVYFYKGPLFETAEWPEFEKFLSKEWNCKIKEELKIPGTEKRFLVGFSPRIVPRGTGKSLVKLSQLF
jgi:16S rRNA (guanine527-N7)-methyltransferase